MSQENNSVVVNEEVTSKVVDEQVEGRVQAARGEQGNYVHIDDAAFLAAGAPIEPIEFANFDLCGDAGRHRITLDQKHEYASPFVQESRFITFPEVDELEPYNGNEVADAIGQSEDDIIDFDAPSITVHDDNVIVAGDRDLTQAERFEYLLALHPNAAQVIANLAEGRDKLPVDDVDGRSTIDSLIDSELDRLEIPKLVSEIPNQNFEEVTDWESLVKPEQMIDLGQLIQQIDYQRSLLTDQAQIAALNHWQSDFTLRLAKDPDFIDLDTTGAPLGIPVGVIPLKYIRELIDRDIKPLKDTADDDDLQFAELISSLNSQLANNEIVIITGSTNELCGNIAYTVGRFKQFGLPEVVLLGIYSDLIGPILNDIVGFDIKIENERTVSITSVRSSITNADLILANLKSPVLDWLVPEIPPVGEHFETSVRNSNNMDRIFKEIYGSDSVTPIVILTGPVFIPVPGEESSLEAIETTTNFLKVLSTYDLELGELDFSDLEGDFDDIPVEGIPE